MQVCTFSVKVEDGISGLLTAYPLGSTGLVLDKVLFSTVMIRSRSILATSKYFRDAKLGNWQIAGMNG